MNIFICDDDPIIRDELNKLVKEYFKSHSYPIPNFFVFESGEKLIECKIVPDFVFLDIEMPGFSGINIGNKLRSQYSNVFIFVVTAYSEYLDDAMRFNVFRYLSKPISKQRLFKNLKDAINIHTNLNKPIIVDESEVSYTILSGDIVMIETVPEKHKTCIHTTKRKYFSSNTMNYWYDELHNLDSFYQCNRSYIINFKYVSSFNNNTVFLLDNTISAIITKRKFNDFYSTYLMYLENSYTN